MNTETIISFFVASAAIATPVIVSQSPTPKPTAKPTVNSVQTPASLTASLPASLPALPTVAPAQERIKIKISVSALEDLKVRQGDQISKGQILADRTRERERLLEAMRQIQSTIKQTQSAIIPKPPAPKKVPEIGKLPPPLYVEEEAQIASAELRLRQAERELNYWRSTLNSEPMGEAAAVEKARIARDEAAKKVFEQDTKIVLVKELKNLPPATIEHEEKQLEKLKAELDQAESELRVQAGKLGDTSNAKKDKLQQLEINFEQAKANVILAKSKYAKAQKDRIDLEYKDSLDRIRRVEEENQSNQYYARQLQDYDESKRSQNFQVAQLREKLQFIDNQLSQLSNVRSPINGVIRRIKNLGQSDNVISVELTIISGSVGTATDPFISPSPAGTNPEATGTTPRTGTTSNWDD